VRLADGTVETGLIQSEDFGGLTIKAGNKAPRLIPWKDVRETTYRQAEEYVAAQQSLQSGELGKAETEFRALAANTKLRPIVRQQVLFILAGILQDQGKGEEAAKTLKDLMAEFPKGRYLGTSAEILVGTRIAAKDFAGANAELTALETATKDFADFRPNLTVLKGMVLEAQNKLTEAATAYSTVGIAPNASPDVKAQADLGTARVLVAQKKPADAETLLRKVVAQDLPGRILAAAWNGLGDLVVEQGKSSKDKDKILEAAFSYLRASVQYPPLPGDPTREYERGLAGSARCFRFIADLEDNTARKELYMSRSKQRLEVLKKEYPDSEFLTEH
jgi:outer membrane protein assembly factor BamD (BamD/ComL family)